MYSIDVCVRTEEISGRPSSGGDHDLGIALIDSLVEPVPVPIHIFLINFSSFPGPISDQVLDTENIPVKTGGFPQEQMIELLARRAHKWTSFIVLLLPRRLPDQEIGGGERPFAGDEIATGMSSH